MKKIKKWVSILMMVAMIAGLCAIQPQNVKADIGSAKLYKKYVLTTTAEDLFGVFTFTAPYDESYTFTCSDLGGDGSFDAIGFLFDNSVDVDELIVEAEEKVESAGNIHDLIVEDVYPYIASGDDENGGYPQITVELKKDETYSLLVCGFDPKNYGKTEVVVSLTHGEPLIKNRTLETCEEGGYTGDIYCGLEECGKLLEAGETIEGHSPKGEISNDVEATCYTDGYTGDSECTVCGIFKEGTTIAKTEHNYVNNICEFCGNIENARFDKKYTLETTEEIPYKVVGFTAPYSVPIEIRCNYVETGDNWDGYGYLFSEGTDVDSKIAYAIENIKNGNTDSEYIQLYDELVFSEFNDGVLLINYLVEEGRQYYFVLGGCSAEDFGKFEVTIACAHERTEVINKTLSDCTIGGYTGDLYCKDCDSILSEGQQIKAGEHIPEEELSGVCATNCYSKGYTGNVICSVCSTVITKGSFVEKKSHEYENNICKHCGRVQNTNIGDEYTLTVTKDMPYQVVEFTAPATGKVQFYCDYIYEYNEEDYDKWDGYGYLFGEEIDIDEKIAVAISGLNKTNEDEVNNRLDGYLSYSDDSNGNLPVIEKKLEKDKKYYFVLCGYSRNEYGSCILSINCLHDDTEVRNKTLSTCEEGGYSGDVYCKLCKEFVAAGEDIPAGSEHSYESEYFDAVCNAYAKSVYTCVYCDHSYSKVYEEEGYGGHCYIVTGYVKPTCTKDGQTGTSACKYCEQVEYENEVIDAFHNRTNEGGYNPNYIYGYHMVEESCMVDGYTGDVKCSVCDEIIEKGLNISALGHEFEGDYCKSCGVKNNLLPISEDGYYEIASVDDLVLFLTNAHRSIKGKLIKDITVPDNYTNDDIYDCSAEHSVLDGNGHTISNWNLNNRYYIFERVYDSSVIKNLTVQVSAEFESEYDFGVIAKYAYDSRFENITINGSITNKNSEGDYQGGITGYANDCELSDCINNADITIEGDHVGGIVGCGYYLSISNCMNNGDIYSDGDEVAGIIGETYNVKITDCKNTGKITTEDEQAGGIAGDVNDSIIKNCINDGDVQYVGTSDSKEELGGIAGGVYYSIEIINCVNNGNIGGTHENLERVGGIVGWISAYGSVTGCINNGNVNAPGSRAGGIAGASEGDYSYDEANNETLNDVIKIINCVNNGNVNAFECAGGIVGNSYYTEVINCINNGKVTGDYYIAGIIGNASNTTLDRAFNSGIINDGNGEGLVNCDKEVTITNSEAAHTHNYAKETVIKPATTAEEGVCEITCECGDKITKAIPKLTDAGIGNNNQPTIDNEQDKTGTSTVVKKPAKIKITFKKNVKSKKISLKWKKVKGAKGYQIRYSKNTKFKNAKIITTKNNKTKYTIKKLQKKTYYIQVRAYKVVNNKRYVGKWSDKKVVKVIK